MLDSDQKHIHVSCAIIEQDGLLLAAQRSAAMSLPLKWEFPGGKINEGESPAECLKRELFEELEIDVVVGQPFKPAIHHYPTFSVTLYPFICTILSGEITLNEHTAISWLSPSELHTLDWAEADWPIIEQYRKALDCQVKDEVNDNSFK